MRGVAVTGGRQRGNPPVDQLEAFTQEEQAGEVGRRLGFQGDTCPGADRLPFPGDAVGEAGEQLGKISRVPGRAMGSDQRYALAFGFPLIVHGSQYLRFEAALFHPRLDVVDALGIRDGAGGKEPLAEVAPGGVLDDPVGSEREADAVLVCGVPASLVLALVVREYVVHGKWGRRWDSVWKAQACARRGGSSRFARTEHLPALFSRPRPVGSPLRGATRVSMPSMKVIVPVLPTDFTSDPTDDGVGGPTSCVRTASRERSQGSLPQATLSRAIRSDEYPVTLRAV